MGAKSGGAVGWEVIVRTGDCVVGALGARTMRPRVSLLVVACFVDGAGGGQKVSGVTFSLGFRCVVWLGLGLAMAAPAPCLMNICRYPYWALVFGSQKRGRMAPPTTTQATTMATTSMSMQYRARRRGGSGV